MPRKKILSQSDRDYLFALPTDESDFLRYYTFTEQELSIIKQHRYPQK